MNRFSRIRLTQVRTLALVLWPAALLALLVALDAGQAVAEPSPAFRIVVNPNNPITSAPDEMLIDIFLKKRTEWADGETVRPVDLKAESGVRRAFSDSVLHRSVAAVKSYWQQVIFSGRGVPPPELESDDAVVDYVTKHRGAVGYVSGNAALGRAKDITVR
jgi:ABC-type phosphate transport system substrate-binding protein